MAEGGEGEDEIQFLRTVSKCCVDMKLSIRALPSITASLRSVVCSVGREFTALRLTAPLDAALWSVTLHRADRTNGWKRVLKHNDRQRDKRKKRMKTVFAVATVVVIIH